MTANKEGERVSFSGEVVRCTYNSPDYKIYAMCVDKDKYPNVQQNSYGNITILGDLFDLTLGAVYDVTGVAQDGKCGVSYRVKEIVRQTPTDSREVFDFLSEILTVNQAKSLVESYPNIIDLVKQNRTCEVDLSTVKGIKEKTFARIVDKITENFCLIDLISDFKGYLSLAVIRKLYSEYGSIANLKRRLKKDPYACLCSIAGIGFIKADQILLGMEKASKECVARGESPILPFESDLATSKERCLSCVLYLLRENENNGHTKMNLADLRAECMKTVPACVSHFAQALKDPLVYYDVQTMDVALKSTFEEERLIAKKILAGLEADCQWMCDVQKYKCVNGATLSDEQLQVIHNVCKHQVSILNGAAGCGKSYSMKAVIALLDDLNKSYILLSPTGKAAKVLSGFTGRPASTIHRGLGYMGESSWTFCADSPLSQDVVIVDEFSMVDVALFRHLVDAIDFTKTKLLMIGDNAQLPSVSCGNLLHDFMLSGKIPTVTLTKVFRYGEGGLMKVATDVRLGKKYLASSMRSGVTAFGSNKDYVFWDSPSDMIAQRAVSVYRKLLEEGCGVEHVQVLTAKNVGDCGTVVLNAALQTVANKHCGRTDAFESCGTSYYMGDLVLQKANNYKARLSRNHLPDGLNPDALTKDDWPTAFVANGETGIVQRVEKTCMEIRFDDVYVEYDKTDAQNVGLGYAITIHKSQGSSIDNVIVCSPDSHSFMSNANLLYVALTRMKKRCYHIGSMSMVNRSIGKKANLARMTFMHQMLCSPERFGVMDTPAASPSLNRTS